MQLLFVDSCQDHTHIHLSIVLFGLQILLREQWHSTVSPTCSKEKYIEVSIHTSWVQHHQFWTATASWSPGATLTPICTLQPWSTADIVQDFSRDSQISSVSMAHLRLDYWLNRVDRWAATKVHLVHSFICSSAAVPLGNLNFSPPNFMFLWS